MIPYQVFNTESLDGGPLHDRYFRNYPDLLGKPGSFKSTKYFNNYFQFATLSWILMHKRNFKDPYRHYLCNNGSICFSHGGLRLRNIMILDDLAKPRRVTSILNWDEAGWYPDYWEYCKMSLAVGDHRLWQECGSDENTRGCIDRIFPKRYHNDAFVVVEYWSWRGYPS